MFTLIKFTLIYFAVLTSVAIGGMFSERSGVINIGLEGIMVFGALDGALTMIYLPATLSPVWIVILTILAAVLCGIIGSLFLAVACITFKADQTLVGTAINMLAVAAATVIVKSVNLGRIGKSTDIVNYIEQQKAFVFTIGKLELSWFVVIAFVLVIVSYIVLYKTRFGLRLMACGEHPQAANSVGVDVIKMRYAGVLISGAIGGFGGITYIAANASTWQFSNGVLGAGFLALAVMIFGQWKPIRIALAAILFGFFTSLSSVYFGFDFLLKLGIPGAVYNMLPYIISLVVLAFTSKKSRAPKAEGIPYDKGQR